MKLIKISALVVCLAILGGAPAKALTISPADVGIPNGYEWSYTPPNNMDAGQIQAYIEGTLGLPITGSLSELFSQDPTGEVSSDTLSPAISPGNYTDLWLYVKDGNHTPTAYLFNLTALGWTGDSISLVNFWPGPGSISHSAILGSPGSSVPDGGTTVMLLGAALSGLAMLRRKLA